MHATHQSLLCCAPPFAAAPWCAQLSACAARRSACSRASGTTVRSGAAVDQCCPCWHSTRIACWLLLCRAGATGATVRAGLACRSCRAGARSCINPSWWLGWTPLLDRTLAPSVLLPPSASQPRMRRLSAWAGSAPSAGATCRSESTGMSSRRPAARLGASRVARPQQRQTWRHVQQENMRGLGQQQPQRQRQAQQQQRQRLQRSRRPAAAAAAAPLPACLRTARAAWRCSAGTLSIGSACSSGCSSATGELGDRAGGAGPGPGLDRRLLVAAGGVSSRCFATPSCRVGLSEPTMIGSRFASFPRTCAPWNATPDSQARPRRHLPHVPSHHPAACAVPPALLSPPPAASRGGGRRWPSCGGAAGGGGGGSGGHSWAGRAGGAAAGAGGWACVAVASWLHPAMDLHSEGPRRWWGSCRCARLVMRGCCIVNVTSVCGDLAF